MITFTLTADTVEELRTMAIKALDIGVPDLPFRTAIAAPPEIKPTTAAERKKQEARDRLRGKPVVEPQPEPVLEIDPVDEPDPEPDPEPQPEPQPEPDEPDAIEVAVADVIALEKLKAETMILIQDMFAAGKVKHIRAVLDKHGGGAKSFPEIEAKEFPVISAALKAA